MVSHDPASRRRRHLVSADRRRARRARWTRYLADVPDDRAPAESARDHAPHAGLMFSGRSPRTPTRRRVAARTTSPCWWARRISSAFDGVALYPGGRLRLAARPARDRRRRCRGAARHSPSCSVMPAPHEREHSLEMQLPFLKRVLPDVPIVPLLMGYQDRETIVALGDAIAEAFRSRRALLVASTDLSHYFDAETAATLDGRSQAVRRRVRCRTACSSCSSTIRKTSAGATWRAAAAGDRGDDGGARARRDGRRVLQVRPLGRDLRRLRRRRRLYGRGVRRRSRVDMLTDAQKRAAARSSRGSRSMRAGCAEPRDAGARSVAAGRVGRVRHDQAARRAARMPRHAAVPRRPRRARSRGARPIRRSEDPRFPPGRARRSAGAVGRDSVLGPLEADRSARPGAIAIGRHGLVVGTGRRRGLLLPQVATEWGWTAEQFLRQTCLKAGLPYDAWQHGARVFRFEARCSATMTCPGSARICPSRAACRARSIARRPRAARRCRSSRSRQGSGAPGRCRLKRSRCFRARVAETGIQPVVAHNSYLINVAAAAPALRAQSIAALGEELDRAEALGLDGLVMHPGSYTTGTEQAGLRLIAEALAGLLRGAAARADEDPARAHRRPGDEPRPSVRAPRCDHRRTRTDRRGSACASTPVICSRPATTSASRGRLRRDVREFDRIVGLDRIRAFHLNDSKKPCGSRVDRHEHIGKGCLGSNRSGGC